MANTGVTYRGVQIERNFLSPYGTGVRCTTQQGWRIGSISARSSGLEGWFPSIKSAKDWVDYCYGNPQASEATRRLLTAAVARQMVEYYSRTAQA